MHITSFALTHPGLRRESNEDSCAARPNLGFWVVCDGMGGHAAGEVASKVATDAIEAFVETTAGVDAGRYAWPFGYDPAAGVDGTRLVTAFRLANRAIDVRMMDDPALRGMATTAVALLLALPSSSPAGIGIRGGDSMDGGGSQSEGDGPTTLQGLVAHVGDSRAYLWREGALTRLTADHSWVEEQMALGELSAEEARTHPWRNLVTRALGGGPDPRVDLTPLALEPGDRVLLCSDGLTTPLPDETIAGILASAARSDAEALCRILTDAANAAGGPDNITVAIVDVH